MMGYKVFDEKLQWFGFQYQVGKTFTMLEPPVYVGIPNTDIQMELSGFDFFGFCFPPVAFRHGALAAFSSCTFFEPC